MPGLCPERKWNVELNLKLNYSASSPLKVSVKEQFDGKGNQPHCNA